ncbi:MAG: hypothetical protein KAJ18_12260, partial [Candidatus Omnitrophica bacterium]|nr:hypothetical protein [Candidatus Omnitrophota bacterium]
MSNLAVAVIAHKRPNYLYVTLDGLFALKGIEGCRATVYCDGGLDPDMRTKQLGVAFAFPIHDFVLHTEA